jgi:UDP-glucose 4-epimerase
MTKVLVTGGAGFLGSHVADALTAQGFEVVIFDWKPSLYLRPEQTMIVGDILDRVAVERAIVGCETVYHLAALADLNEARTRPVEAAQLNILGTINLLEAARQAKVRRFLFASTIYVYSREGGFYRASKQACETYIEEYQRQFDLEYTILRYGSLYGPRADEHNGVYRLLMQAVNTGHIQHVGTPDDAREYVHVEDAARLSVDVLADVYANQNIIITGQHPIRLHDLFMMFSEILGRKIDVEYVTPGSGSRDGHYQITPYAFTPRVGHKLTSNYYVDMGQGLLQILEESHRTKQM